MIKAFQLIFSPAVTWEEIVSANRGFFSIVFLYLLPLMLISAGIEGYSLVRLGERRGQFDYVVSISQQLALRYEITQVLLGFAIIWVGARFLQAVGTSFELPSTYLQSFTTIAYGFSPIFLTRALDAIPALNTWICWAIGALIAISVLYHGIALVLKPDQTKGFGLYLLSIIFVLFLSGLAHFVAVSVLHEKLLK
ncbi:MAG: YIP1 family protein [Verrucomicrobiota bacterium]